MSVISPSSRPRATTVVFSLSRNTSFSGVSSTRIISFDVRPLTRIRLTVRLELEVVQEPRRHQHGHVAAPQRHERTGAVLVSGPERVGYLRVRPQS